jgi:hypothetical protein
MEASCNEVVPTKSGDLWRLTSHVLIMSQSREMWRLSSGGSRGVRPGGGARTGGSGAGAWTTEPAGPPPNSKPRRGAGDETRSRDIQLGRNMHESEFRIAGWRRQSALLQLLTNRRHWARLSAAFSTAGTERPHPGGRTWHRGPTLSPAAIGWITATGRATGNAVTRRSEAESGRLRIRPRRCELRPTNASVKAGQVQRSVKAR